MVTHITASSAVLSWRTNVAGSYIIAYGTEPNSLTTKKTVQANGTNVSIELNGLPAGKKLYVAVTPSNDGTIGTTRQVAFKTASHSIVGPLITIIVLLVLLFIIFRLIRQQRGNARRTPQYTIDDQAEIFHQEDPATYNSRLNWWQDPSAQQPAGQDSKAQPAPDDIPDMFEEGRKRLDKIAKTRRPPKS